MGLLFVSPWILWFLLFTVYPLGASLYYSLTRYDIVRAPVFLGLKNYQTIFTTDPHFWNVMYNTIYYVCSVKRSAGCDVGLFNCEFVQYRDYRSGAPSSVALIYVQLYQQSVREWFGNFS